MINWLSEKDISIQSYKTEADTELKWTETYIPKIHEWLETNYPGKDYRLPSLFSPLKYNVLLSPHFEDKDFTFNGSVQIQMTRLKSRISRIVLNAQELEIKRVKVYEINSDLTTGKELEVSSYIKNKVTETLTIFMKAFIKSDHIIVDIDFTGYLNEKLQGFYRSYYHDSEGNIRLVGDESKAFFEYTYHNTRNGWYLLFCIILTCIALQMVGYNSVRTYPRKKSVPLLR